MILNPKINTAGASVIILAGAEYFIPLLALRQARIVVPGLLKLMPRLNAIQSLVVENPLAAGSAIEQADVDQMVDVVHAALTRAYPDATRDEILDMETTFPELVASLSVIARQTGLFTPVGDAQGEAKGEAAPPISTESLPDIVNIPESPGPTL